MPSWPEHLRRCRSGQCTTTPGFDPVQARPPRIEHYRVPASPDSAGYLAELRDQTRAGPCLPDGVFDARYRASLAPGPYYMRRLRVGVTGGSGDATGALCPGVVAEQGAWQARWTVTHAGVSGRRVRRWSRVVRATFAAGCCVVHANDLPHMISVYDRCQRPPPGAL
jgi:hypothetical protein